MYRKKHLSLAVSTALGLSSFLMIPGQVLAQDQLVDEEGGEMLEEIVVTGSRIISEDGFGQTSPVTVVGMDDISSYGLTRIEDVLNNLPQIDASNVAFDSNGATGTASIDLRGLGTNRTLVLINGRRVQSGGVTTESADVNQIPTSMIERVEVLTGGASATYGADAVAGVVNFIMRRLNGVEFSAGISAYQHDNDDKYMQGLMDEAGFAYETGSTGFDGSGYNIDFAFGSDFADGKGNATMFATWRNNAKLLQGARDYSSCALDAEALSCGGSSTTPNPNFRVWALDADGQVTGPRFTGTLQPDSSLEPFTDNLYNYNPVNFFFRPQTSWSAGMFADYEINEHAVVYMETMLAQTASASQIAESGTFYAEVYNLPLSNSLFPAAFRASLEQQFPGEDELGIMIGKRNVEGGGRANDLQFNSFRIVSGIKGVINENWDYDASFMHAQSNSSSTYLNDFFAPNISQAINGDLCAQDTSCIPYEVFTYNGVTPEAARNMQGTGVRTNRTNMDIFEAFVTGDTGWGLPAGNIMMAAGYQWVQNYYNNISDTVYSEGLLLGQGGPTPSVGGIIRSNQLFVEGSVPLFADEAWAQQMNLDLAYRWSDYNTTGTNSTYRVGIDWQIVDMFRVRTGYNQAVRAPSVRELFSPQSLGLWTGTDPCAGASPELTEAQCANTGVLPGDYGNVEPSPAGQYNGIYGGNPNTDVEKAKTFTLGFVVNPMDSMQFSVDYWDIKIDDTISGVSPEESLNQCGADAASLLCGNIHRGIGGTLWLGTFGWVDTITQNIGTNRWKGVDVAWAWGLGTNWNFDLLGTYSLKREITPIPDDPESAYDCAGLISPSCYPPNPSWRHTATATYDSNSWWAATARWRYYGKVDYEGTVDELALADGGIKATNYLDLNAVFRFMDTNDVSVGVNNVFDKTPPILGNTLSSNGNVAVGFYDTLGRYFFANVTMRW